MKTSPLLLSALRLSTALFGFHAVSAQTQVDLSGTVLGADGKPVQGVAVVLSETGLSDTSKADGTWAIRGSAIAVKPRQIQSTHLICWIGPNLVTQFDAPMLVRADLFDAAGHRLAALPPTIVGAGFQALSLGLPRFAGARWLRVQAGDRTTVLSAHSGVSAPGIALPASLARAARGTDNLLIYSLQGQIITEDKLDNLIAANLYQYIKAYDISADMTFDSRVKVDSVWAWFIGGAMANPLRARMAADAINERISGRVYTVRPKDAFATYNFRTWLNVQGNGNRLTGISDTIAFTTDFGGIVWKRKFSSANAFPDGSIICADSVEAGNGLNLSLRLAHLDTANHRVKDSVIKAEWDLADGQGWRVSTSLPPVVVAKWSASGFDTVKLRVMDADSNAAIITKAIKVVNSGSALRLTSGPIDTVIAPSDTVSFQLYVRDTSGVAKVIWSYGDGKFDTTKTGAVHAVKHAYPGPSVVAAGKDSTFALTVTVIDSLGGSTTQKLSNVKVANVVLTGTVTGATSGLVNTVYPFAATVVPAGKRIAHAEWDQGDGQGWRAGTATSYQAKWLKPGAYSVKVRLTDKDSNVVTLTAAAIVVTNPKAAVSIVSIVDPNLAVSTGKDTVITPSDTVTFMLTVSDPNGVAKVLWDFGDGKFDSTPAGSAQSIKHVYPDTSLVKADKYIWKTFTLSLRLIDSLGDTTINSHVANILQVNISPRMKITGDSSGYADSILSFGSLITTKTTPTYYSKIVSHEWSTDNVTFGIGSADTLLRLPHLPTSNFRLYARVIDEDGNVSNVDSIRIIVYGKIVDARDNQMYKYIKIGTQTWMAENLNYRPAGNDSGWCYNNRADLCAQYGRLYAWAEAMGIDTIYNRVVYGSEPQGAGLCPRGWHVPRDAEWQKLTDTLLNSSTAGLKLKSTQDWSGGGGTDDYAYSALPSGYASNGTFGSIGTIGFWWSSSEGGGGAWARRISYDMSDVYRRGSTKTFGFSVRCTQD